jgi:hypothetical protein
MAKKKAARASWFDAKTNEPLIQAKAKQLKSFMKTMEDGLVEQEELDAQEERLVALMKEVEALLDDAQHARVTELLCELTAYDLMQTLYALQQARPVTKFRG